jgi:esterase/lipase superfamily enzyme
VPPQFAVGPTAIDPRPATKDGTMKRGYERWHSPALGRDMELLLFGHAGARVIAFPTSCGRFFDWEGRGLVEALRDPIVNGRLQLCCVDSVDRESWYSRENPAGRGRRHDQYDRYVLDEVLPFTRAQNPDPFVITTGASFGGYHAVNFGLKHPTAVNRVLGMSGIYDIRRFANGHYDDTVYFNNPCDFIANEHEPARLEALRKLQIIIAIGRDDSLFSSNQRLSELLWSKNVWHALRVWDGWAHDWQFWARMLQLYIGGPD